MADFDENIIERVWQKALAVENNDPNIYRKDYSGAWIRRDQYGKQTEYGWEIDHLNPISKGGTDDINNLYTLQWENNRMKSDNYPNFNTGVSSSGIHNIKNVQAWIAQR